MLRHSPMTDGNAQLSERGLWTYPVQVLLRRKGADPGREQSVEERDEEKDNVKESLGCATVRRLAEVIYTGGYVDKVTLQDWGYDISMACDFCGGARHKVAQVLHMPARR